MFHQNRFSVQTWISLLKNVMNGEHQLPLCISSTMMTPEVVSVIFATA
jgi:hypothetical protein